MARYSVAECGSRALATFAALASLVVRVDEQPRPGDAGARWGVAAVTCISAGTGSAKSFTQGFAVSASGAVRLLPPDTTRPASALLPFPPPAQLTGGTAGGRRAAAKADATPVSVVSEMEPAGGVGSALPSGVAGASGGGAAPGGVVLHTTRGRPGEPPSGGVGPASAGVQLWVDPASALGTASDDDDGGWGGDGGDMDDDLDL